MLNKAAQEKLLKALKFEPEKIAELLGKNEVDVELPSLHVFDDSSLSELKLNVRKGYEEAFPEIKGKDLNAKYELGLSTTDAKNFDKIMEAMKAKGVAEAGVAPNDKIKELTASLKKLQEEVIPSKDAEVTNWMNKYKEREVFDKYASVVPENANKYLTKDEHVGRIRKTVGIGENGEAINPATGQAYKDNMEKAIAFNDYVSHLYKTNEGWLQPEQKPIGQTFHHGTQGGNSGNGSRSVDIDAIKSKYNLSDPKQRQAMQAEITTAMLNTPNNI